MPPAKPLDWLGLVALVIMFGSAFMLTKLAVQEYPPAIVTAGRIIIAAVILLPIAWLRGESFGFLRDTWLLIIALAVTGNCLPFYLISWGQQTVSSSTAGILMAVMPLATILLAHFFVAGERLTTNRVIGFLLGFLGILILLGPAALAELEGSTNVVIAMLVILAGALCYAINTILAKRLPNASFVAISAAVMVAAGLLMLPTLMTSDNEWVIELHSIEFLSLVILGVFPTALAAMVYFAVIARTGPSFLSQINYLIPVWAVFMGIAFLHEAVSMNAFIALAVILLGIAFAQRRRLFFARF